ncbi:MAG: nucleotidyltransferase family protein, partial [Oscillospiraceae bacterium]|nr:nucleotidyltransferase family protein [Oscillospiraceae bacterium]
MTREEYRAAIMNVVYLAACAVEKKPPDARRTAEMDLSALYSAAERHSLTGITAMALESAGIKDEAFTQARGKAIRKAAAFDLERAAVLRALEQAGIWYAPVKGAVIRELYPAI